MLVPSAAPRGTPSRRFTCEGYTRALPSEDRKSKTHFLAEDLIVLLPVLSCSNPCAYFLLSLCLLADDFALLPCRLLRMNDIVIRPLIEAEYIHLLLDSFVMSLAHYNNSPIQCLHFFCNILLHLFTRCCSTVSRVSSFPPLTYCAVLEV